MQTQDESLRFRLKNKNKKETGAKRPVAAYSRIDRSAELVWVAMTQPTTQLNKNNPLRE